MGSVLALPIIALAASILPFVFHRPSGPNPALGAMEAYRQAEQSMNAALQAARDANELVDQMRQDAERERQEARLRQEEAERAVALAADEVERMRAQVVEAATAARRAEELADAAARAAREDAARFAEEAQEERERAQKTQEEAERAISAMTEESERKQQIADEQRRQAELAGAQAERKVREAVEEARKAEEAKKNAEERLKKGIQPVVTPSLDEVAAAKRRVEYREDCFHFAIAGVSGSGKSSLVNSFRGLRSRDEGAAAVGITETTLQMSRYPDPNPNNPFVWYDIPGAGTLKCSDWQYFNNQGLYVFDCIIVLFDNRFTVTDVAILTNARRFNIPTYIVRSKADQHIWNTMKEMEYGDDDEDDVERRDRLYRSARKQFVDNTRRSVRDNLRDADLDDQRVYIVSNTALFSIVQNKIPKKAIDEVDLINDLINEAYRRRGARVTSE